MGIIDLVLLNSENCFIFIASNADATQAHIVHLEELGEKEKSIADLLEPI